MQIRCYFILILPNKCMQEDVILSLETCLQGCSFSHTPPLMRFSNTVCLRSAGASFMAFSISGGQCAYNLIYFLCLKENTYEELVTDGCKKPSSQNKCHLGDYPPYLVPLLGNSHNRRLLKRKQSRGQRHYPTETKTCQVSRIAVSNLLTAVRVIRLHRRQEAHTRYKN